MINLAEIQVGDRVGIMDRAGNMARGEVMQQGVLCGITAFGTPLYFARVNANGRVVPEGPVRVIEHTPVLVRAS